jgi:hypothetical protein
MMDGAVMAACIATKTAARQSSRMDSVLRKRPRPIAATIGLFFAGLWCWLGAQGLPPAWQTPAGIAGILVSLVLIARQWRMETPSGTGNMIFGRPAYFLAVAFEIAAIVAFINLAPHYGWQHQFLPALGVIVGLHFIGLWVAAGMRRGAARLLWIAGAMCVVSALSAWLPWAYGGFDPRDAACGFANALVLWIGASRLV